MATTRIEVKATPLTKDDLQVMQSNFFKVLRDNNGSLGYNKTYELKQAGNGLLAIEKNSYFPIKEEVVTALRESISALATIKQFENSFNIERIQKSSLDNIMRITFTTEATAALISIYSHSELLSIKTKPIVSVILEDELEDDLDMTIMLSQALKKGKINLLNRLANSSKNADEKYEAAGIDNTEAKTEFKVPAKTVSIASYPAFVHSMSKLKIDDAEEDIYTKIESMFNILLDETSCSFVPERFNFFRITIASNPPLSAVEEYVSTLLSVGLKATLNEIMPGDGEATAEIELNNTLSEIFEKLNAIKQDLTPATIAFRA